MQNEKASPQQFPPHLLSASTSSTSDCKPPSSLSAEPLPCSILATELFCPAMHNPIVVGVSHFVPSFSSLTLSNLLSPNQYTCVRLSLDLQSVTPPRLLRQSPSDATHPDVIRLDAKRSSQPCFLLVFVALKAKLRDYTCASRIDEQPYGRCRRPRVLSGIEQRSHCGGQAGHRLCHSCSVQFFPFTFASLPVSTCQVHSLPSFTFVRKCRWTGFPNEAIEDYLLTSTACGSHGSLSARPARPARWLPRAARTLFLLNVLFT